MGIEFELKYRATPEQQEKLCRAIKGEIRTITMETTYYDTPGRTLSARHITLRRRMENDVSVCTVKTPAPGGARGEWECLCDDIEAAIPMLCKLGAPEELLDWTAEGVTPVCGARFTRRAVDYKTNDFSAEMALDNGILLGGGRNEPLCEVEFELKSGNQEAMKAYTQLLAGVLFLQREPKSKFRRAMALAEEC